MSEGDTTACISCKQSWENVPRAFRIRATATAKKGDPLPRCEACQKKSNHTETRKKRKLNEIEDNGADLVPSLIEKAGLEQALQELAEGPWTTFEGTVIGFKIDDESVKECALRVAHMVLRCLGYKFTSVIPCFGFAAKPGADQYLNADFVTNLSTRGILLQL
jgi:hypothetical protein